MNLNPYLFIKKRGRGLIAALLFLVLLLTPFVTYKILNAPDDYLQGSYVRIMFIHVPSAWLSLVYYGVLTLCSIGFIVYRNIAFFKIGHACAVVGFTLTLIALVTGSLWGRPTWGSYWVWDARLTSMLLLAFIYLGYLLLSKSYQEKIIIFSSYYAILGAINIPIVKFSVYLWSSLHQKSSFITEYGVKMHDEILVVLLFSFLEVLLLSVLSVVIYVRLQMVKLKLKKIEKAKSVSAFVAGFSAVCMVLFSSISDSFAGAWTLDKGQKYFSIAPYYTTPFKYTDTGSHEDDNNEIINYRSDNKLSRWGVFLDGEYGVTSNFTILGKLDASYTEDRIVTSLTTNGTSTPGFNVKTNYWSFMPSLGFRQGLYRDDFNVISYEIEGFLGRFVSGDSSRYVDQQAAVQASLQYGHNFNLPFGWKNRPDYANYIDLKAGPRFYFREHKTELNTEASIGIQPFNKHWIFIGALYDTFHGYNFDERPFSNSSIASAVNGLNISQQNKDYMFQQLQENLRKGTESDFHQVSFQVGYKIDEKYTVYVKTYHNVFSAKPFSVNTYSIALDYLY